ncbi:hypothetical protein Q8A67_023231 [Cirrhinus molitorella]|nr:hypothetical protein Q8A67_023231 [Cirrhinus molitorella]
MTFASLIGFAAASDELTGLDGRQSTASGFGPSGFSASLILIHYAGDLLMDYYVTGDLLVLLSKSGDGIPEDMAQFCLA